MANDPRKILDALRGQSNEPLSFGEAEVSSARALAADPQSATPESIEGLPEPLALAVVEAAIRAKTLPVLDALTRSSKKQLAKAAKKGLYHLKSSGMELPEKKIAEPAAPAAAAVPEEIPPSLVSTITGNGERALIIGRPIRGGRIETLQLVIADEHGVVHLGINEISRGQYKKLLKDAKKPNAPSAVEYSLDEARALLAEGVGLNLRTRTPFPEGLELALRHLEITPEEEPRVLPPPEEGDQGLAVQGARLHQTREISQWLPPVDALRRFSLKAQEIATSSLYVDDKQRAEQLHRTVQQMAEETFTEPVRKLYARRLWHMAELFDRSERPEDAAIARAEARRLFHNAPGLFSPFATALFEKILALSSALPGGAPAPSPEQAAQTEPPGERRSPGGLILP